MEVTDAMAMGVSTDWNLCVLDSRLVERVPPTDEPPACDAAGATAGNAAGAATRRTHTRRLDAWVVVREPQAADAERRRLAQAARRADNSVARRALDAIDSDAALPDVSVDTVHVDGAGRSLFVAACRRAGTRPAAAALARRLLHVRSAAVKAELVSRRSEGVTALTAALRGGDSGLVDLLLECGAAAVAADDDGTTPLHVVARAPVRLDTDTVTALIETGGVNVADARGNTPLDLAVRSCRRDAPRIVRLLADGGAFAGRSDAAGRTAVHWVVHQCLARLFAVDRAAQEAHSRRLGLWRDEFDVTTEDGEDSDNEEDNDLEEEANDKDEAGDAGVGVATAAAIPPRVDVGTQTGDDVVALVDGAPAADVAIGAPGAAAAAPVPALPAAPAASDPDAASMATWESGSSSGDERDADGAGVVDPAARRLVPLCRRAAAATAAHAPLLLGAPRPRRGSMNAVFSVWGATTRVDAPRGYSASRRDNLAAASDARWRSASYTREDEEALSLVNALYERGGDVCAVDCNGLSALDVALGTPLVPLRDAPHADEFIRPCLPRTAQRLREIVALYNDDDDDDKDATVAPAPIPVLPALVGYWEADLHAAVALDDGSGDVVSAALHVAGLGGVGAVDARGRTPLHWAVAAAAPPVTARTAVMTALLDAGADGNAVDASGCTPLGVLLSYVGLDDEASDVVRSMWAAAGAAGLRAARGPTGKTALDAAVAALDVARVQDCLNAGVPVDAGTAAVLEHAWTDVYFPARFRRCACGWPERAMSGDQDRHTTVAGNLTDDFDGALAVSRLLLSSGAGAALSPPSVDVPIAVLAAATLCATMRCVQPRSRGVAADDPAAAASAATATGHLPAVLSLSSRPLDIHAPWSFVLGAVPFIDFSALDLALLVLKRSCDAAPTPGAVDAVVRAIDAAPPPPPGDAGVARLLRALARSLLLPADPALAVATALERAIVRATGAGVPRAALPPMMTRVALCGGPGAAAALRFLLARGALPNARVDARFVPEAGDDDVALHGAPARDGAARTPPLLFALCARAPADAVAVVAAIPACALDAGVDGVPPLLVACGRGDVDVVRALLSAAAGGRPLGVHATVPADWTHPCSGTWDAQVRASERSPLTGATALHLLLRSPYEGPALAAIVAALIAAGAPADAEDVGGVTPLVLAAMRARAGTDYRDVVRALVSAGARAAPAGRDAPSFPATSLLAVHMQQYWANADLLGAALDVAPPGWLAGALHAPFVATPYTVALAAAWGTVTGATAVARGGWWPLALAARAASEPVVRALLAAGACVDDPTPGARYTLATAPLLALALHATEADDASVTACARALLAAGARVDRCTDDGTTVLGAVFSAVSRKRPVSHALLDVVAAAVTAAPRAAWTLDFGRNTLAPPPLHIAVAFGDAAAVQRLLVAGADPNSASFGGREHATPLRCALGTRRVDIAEALLAAGADVNARTGDGRTPLEAVVTASCDGCDADAADAVALLLRAGARPADPFSATGFCALATVVVAAADAAGAGGCDGGVARLECHTRVATALLRLSPCDAGIVVAPPFRGSPLELFVRRHAAARTAQAAADAVRLREVEEDDALWVRGRAHQRHHALLAERARLVPAVAAATSAFVVALVRGGGGGGDVWAPVPCPVTGAIVPLFRAGLLGADAALRRAVVNEQLWGGRAAVVALRSAAGEARARVGPPPASAAAKRARNVAAGDGGDVGGASPSKRPRGEDS